MGALFFVRDAQPAHGRGRTGAVAGAIGAGWTTADTVPHAGTWPVMGLSFLGEEGAYKGEAGPHSNSHFAEERAISHLGAGFSWERRRLACSGSGQDGRAPRGLGNGHAPRLRLFASQRAKMSIAVTRRRGMGHAPHLTPRAAALQRLRLSCVAPASGPAGSGSVRLPEGDRITQRRL